MNRPRRALSVTRSIGFGVALLMARTLELRGQTLDTAAIAARVTAIADSYVRTYTATFPVSAELAGVGSTSRDRLDANDAATLARWREAEDKWAAEVGTINGAMLWGRREWVTYGFLREAIEASRQMRVCHAEWWPINQMFGWQAFLPEVAANQPVGNAKARRDAIARWSAVPKWLDTEIENARRGLREGYTTPRAPTELVRQQLSGLLALPDTAWPFYSPAVRDSDPAFRKAWRTLISERIRPAVVRYRDFLVSEYLPATRDTLAITAIPNGRECYQAEFRANTSLSRSPEETYRLGLATVEAYQREIQRVGRQQFKTDDLSTLLALLDSAPGFASREDKLAFAQSALDRARAAVPQWFGHLSPAQVTIEPYPSYLETGSSDSYWAGSQDGARPGKYRINLGTAQAGSRAAAERTAFHETYPGHHLQISLAQSLPAHPITQLVSTGAFTEGWARYAEGLAEEMGLYTSPLAPIARRAWPAHGMVADVGLHVLGWSRDSVASYVSQTRVSSRDKAMNSMVMRFAVLPSQITSYDTGALEILELRRLAERELGPKFDIRKFHDRVLGNGSITLPMLRESVTRWIAEQQAP